MKRLFGIIISGALAVAALGTAGAASAGSGGNAKLSVVHGIPGAAVDVCVDGAEAKSNFTYKQTFSAALPAGEYKVKVRLAKSGTCTGDVVLRARPTVEAGRNYTAVAGFAANGNPKLFLFGNDVSKTRSGEARLTVRHTAAAPKVDVYADGAKLLSWFKNGESAKVEVPKGSYRVKVNVAGTHTTAIGPKRFDLMGGTAYQVYAVGNKLSNYAFVATANNVGSR